MLGGGDEGACVRVGCVCEASTRSMTANANGITCLVTKSVHMFSDKRTGDSTKMKY